MTHKGLILSLAKVLAAAAWADGQLSDEEIASLKGLVYQLPNLTRDDWAQLAIFMDSPVGGQEADVLLRELMAHMSTEEDKEFVVKSLSYMIEPGGALGKPERAALEEMRSVVSLRDTRLLTQLRSFLSRSMDRLRTRPQPAATREARISDFITNTVYYEVSRALQARGERIELAEEPLRKVCLAAGLMALVAHADESIGEEEKAAISRVIAKGWGLPAHEASLVTEISCSRMLKGLDVPRLLGEFLKHTKGDEREALLEYLISVASSANRVCSREQEEIRRIAEGLHILPEAPADSDGTSGPEEAHG